MGGRAEDALTPSRRVIPLALLAAAMAIGAWLRFDRLGVPSYWLDEILHQHLTTVAATKPWWQWFGRIQEEHAGLYYLTQLITRAFGTSEFAGRSAAAFFGLLTIPLVGFGARLSSGLLPSARGEGARSADEGWWPSAVAAILLAVSPLHVYYSREARGYALLMLLTAALIVILLRGRSLLAACIVLLMLLYTSAVAAPILLSAAAVSFAVALLSREQRRWYVIGGACAILTLALIRVIYVSRPMYDPGLPGAPPMGVPFFQSLARMFSVSALGAEVGGRAAAAMLLFAMIGVIALAKRDVRHAIVLAGMTVLPLAITLVSLRVYDHFFAVRYVVASLVGYVMLAAIGIAFVAQLIARRFGPVLAVAIAILIAAQGWDAARTEPFQKLDWRGIAATLKQHLRPGDVILSAEPWSDVSLRYYLGELPNVRQVYMAGVGIAQIMVDETHGNAWLVSAGTSTDTSVRTWMCRYPVVLASRLENFRLHYAGSRRDFLQTRTRAPEQRAISAALGDRGFTIAPDDELLFGDGWADAEGAFRWAVGRRATLPIPRRAPADRVIRFRAYPLTHPSLAPQVVRVLVNDTLAGAITLAPEWREYSVSAPAASWREGLNTIAFEFDRSTAPSALDASSSDHRDLAASFERISIDNAGYTSTKPHGVTTLRIAADVLIDANRNAAQHLRNEPLLGRLGLDPLANVDLETATATIAAGSDCEDDHAFLDRAFAIILERPPDPVAQRDLLQRLHDGATREEVIARIVKSDEFRALERRRPAG